MSDLLGKAIAASLVPVPAVKRPPMWLVAWRWQPDRRDGSKAIDWSVENFKSLEEAQADAQTNGGVVFYLPGSEDAK